MVKVKRHRRQQPYKEYIIMDKDGNTVQVASQTKEEAFKKATKEFSKTHLPLKVVEIYSW